ncbi:MAG: cyclic nucleotide-binding domain-containing protein [Lachnospiraceae bacterium]|nr:cyclic nucleotide-binding domain-containing protein [Lachnospiraceae bacterium]
MAIKRITDKYLADFFGIDDSEQGQAELADIRKKLVRQQYENGTDVCVIDEEPDGMFFLETGTAIVLGREGEQLNILHEGQYFGEYGVLSGNKRLSTVRSLGRTIVFKLESDDMMEILSRHPEIYGKLMKRVYGQVSRKHSQILELSGLRKGILQHPRNETPMSKGQMAVQYGILALVYLAAYFIPLPGGSFPVFLFPLGLMLVYVVLTKRTLESLVASIILAAVLLYKEGVSAGFVDAVMDTMELEDNVFTVLVMALMGGMIQLITASGAITAFKKMVDKKIHGQNETMLAACGIMTATCIDDGLNMSCAALATNSSAKEHMIPREKLALIYSLLPTALCSFMPLSLWGIFVIGTLTATVRAQDIQLFCRSIPFNFFSILTVAAILMLCFGRLPLSRKLKHADARVESGGTLWPAGSEKYLNVLEPEMWGKIYNIMLPILVLAISSLAVRSILAGRFIVDSACGLVVTLLFMFLLYCAQGLMTPEQFMEHLVTGIANTTLPIIMYLLTICFANLLDALSLENYFLGIVEHVRGFGFMLPAFIFITSMLLTVVLGSSWSMYAIVFPIAIHMAGGLGIDLALCVGAVCGAGIAGEYNCMFTVNALDVGTVIGCDPGAVRSVRMTYSIALTLITALLYLAAGVLVTVRM